VPSPHPDLKLVEDCRNEVPGAFEALYRAHAARLFGLASRLVGRVEAEDLLQDAFLTAYRKLGQYKGDAALGTWLFRIATNVCLDYLRSRAGRFAQLSEALDEDTEDPIGSGPVLAAVDRLDVERALTTLPGRARAVFVLHDVEGLEHREIATLLGIAEGTSKSQLHKARLRIRDVLRPGVRAHRTSP
jgi:RNA polymerase sigma-70 factor (ECF subfamily)